MLGLDDQVVRSHYDSHPEGDFLVVHPMVRPATVVVMETGMIHKMEINHHTEVSCQSKSIKLPFHMLIQALEG